MTQEPAITARLATIEAVLAEILDHLRPDPTPPQFGQMLGTQHFATSTQFGYPRTFSHNASGPQELTLIVGEDGRLIVDGGSKG